MYNLTIQNKQSLIRAIRYARIDPKCRKDSLFMNMIIYELPKDRAEGLFL